MKTEDTSDDYTETDNVTESNDANNSNLLVEPAGSQDTTQNPWPHLNDFLEFKSRSGEKLIYECKLCVSKLSIIKAHVSSLNNLKQHMKRTHASKYIQFEERVRSGSTRGKKKSKSIGAVDMSDIDSNRSDLFSSTPNKRLRRRSFTEFITTDGEIPQARVDQCIVNFFVDNMIPLHVVESDTFEKLIKTLNPNTNTMSTSSLGKSIIDSHAQVKQYLIKMNKATAKPQKRKKVSGAS